MASRNHRDDFVVIQTIFPPDWAVADNLCTESLLYNYHMQPTETKKVETIRSFPAMPIYGISSQYFAKIKYLVDQ